MILQNPFPATHVFSQLSALLPGCHRSLRLFSIICRLFLQNTGGGVSLIPATLRDSVRFAHFVTFLRHAPARYILRAGFTRGFHDESLFPPPAISSCCCNRGVRCHSPD